jgi:hypothetical protein
MSDRAEKRASSPSASNMTDEAQGVVGSILSAAQEAARRLAEEQKSAATEQIGAVADMVDNAAHEIEHELPMIAPYVQDAAAAIRRAAGTLRERSVDDLLSDVAAFGRRQPLLLLGGAMLAGFAVARLMMSSAERQRGASADRTARESDLVSTGTEPTSATVRTEEPMSPAIRHGT